MGAFLTSLSNLLFTDGLQLLEIVFSAKSPCNIGNVDDDIKFVLSIDMRLGDQADGSSVAVQCGNEKKSKCNSCAGLLLVWLVVLLLLLLTLEVIQLTKFLLGFDADAFELCLGILSLVDCSFSTQYGTDNGLSRFGCFDDDDDDTVLVDRILGISNDDENNGS